MVPLTTPEVLTCWPTKGLVDPLPWISMIVWLGGVLVPHDPSGAAVLRGFGGATAKSALFWSVSVQPPAARWSAVGRYNWSIRDERLLEAIAGIEYNAGCWAMRFVAQRLMELDVDNRCGAGHGERTDVGE